MKRIAAIGCCCLFSMVLSACAGLGEGMNAWMGRHSDELLEAWGPPSQEATLTDGRTSIVYARPWRYEGGGGTCRKIFTLDTAHIIRTWAYSSCLVWPGFIATDSWKTYSP